MVFQQVVRTVRIANAVLSRAFFFVEDVEHLGLSMMTMNHVGICDEMLRCHSHVLVVAQTADGTHHEMVGRLLEEAEHGKQEA